VSGPPYRHWGRPAAKWGGPLAQFGRPSGPIRAARQKKVGGHTPKSGGPKGGPQFRSGLPPWPKGRPQGGHPQNEGGPYRKRAAARAALRKRGGLKAGPTGRQAGPGGPSGRPSGQVAARRAARAGPKGGQGRARGRPTGPPSRPDHSVKCAGSSKTGSGDLFLPISFGVCVKDALFLPPRGPPPPPQAHQRPRPVKATTYRTPVPNTLVA
jgi:hypothetical protein